jgi:adenine-specific DNA-methyltransferase
MIYGERSNGGHLGLVLTKTNVVEVMLDRVGYTASRDLSQVSVIEPAAGDGAFSIEIITRLYQSSLNFNFVFKESLANLAFYEMDLHLAQFLEERIRLKIADYGEFIPANLVNQEDFLLSNPNKCDLVVGNPPYVRHENIPKDKKELYRIKFATFKHRSDLYIAFYEKALHLLKPNGVLSFICSNRWLKNQYGQSLRHLIGLSYSLTEIIDLEKTNPFQEEVIAYPAITTIQKNVLKKSGNYYSLDTIDELTELNSSTVPSRQIHVRNSLNWFSSNYHHPEIEKSLGSIEGQGFKIGIGVATGLDRVFIRKDFPTLVEPEVLLPLLISRDTRNNVLAWSGNYILNPFDKSGSLIDLNKYPKAKTYLESEKDALSNRHTAKKNTNAWYKTIDKINPDLTGKDKILLPDISGNNHLLIDRGDFYPHHNLYYITGTEYGKLVLLAAILMSDFVKDQLMEFGNKMNGGYPRWQSQNLKRLRIPILDSIPTTLSKRITDAYFRKDYDTINQLISLETISEMEVSSGQMSFFEPREEYQVHGEQK